MKHQPANQSTELGQTGLNSGLSNMQMLIWSGQQLEPDAPIYNSAFRIHIPSRIDPEVFEASFRKIVENSDCLRTTIRLSNGIPLREIVRQPNFKFPLVDFSEKDDPRKLAHLWCERRCQKMLPMDSLMFDTALLKLADDSFIWFINQHHLICDAWGVTQLFRLQNEFYSSMESGANSCGKQPELIFQTDPGQRKWEPKKRSPAALAFYGVKTNRIGSASDRVAVCYSENVETPISVHLNEIADHKLARSFSKQMGMFNVVLTLLFSYLARTTGEKTFCVGVPFHNRLTPEAKLSTGPFISFHSIEMHVVASETFASLLKKVQTATNRYLQEAVSGKPSSSSSANFQTIFNFIHAKFDDFGSTPVTPHWLHPMCHDAQHPLRLHAGDFEGTGTTELNFDFNRDVFDETAQQHAVHHFSALVNAMAIDIDRTIGCVDLLAERERIEQRVCLKAKTPAKVHRQVIEQFETVAQQYPNDVAIVIGERQLTYQQLADEIEQIVHLIEQHPIAPQSRIGICLHRSLEAVVSILAVMKSGHTFVPIDPAWPETRKQYVLKNGQIGWQFAPSLTPVCIDDALECQPVSNAAYVIYTSGSTGTPKGVEISHSALANYIGWAGKYYGNGRRLSYPLFTPLTFDLTITSLFVPLTTGGQVVIYAERDDESDIALLNVIDDNLVDVIKLTPSHLGLLANRKLPDSRVGQLILGGEELKTELVNQIASTFPAGLLVHNEYGPTEATVGCIVHTVDASQVGTAISVPIGHPIAGMQAYVLNENLQPVPTGVPGELFLSGVGLANGYVGQPKISAEKFPPCPFEPDARMHRTGDTVRINADSLLEYLGREDQQVKIRGARVELGAIETALSKHPLVSRSIVTTFGPAQAQQHLDYCRQCGLASNYPDVSFDEEMICSVCRSFSTYRDNAQAYFEPLAELQSIFDERRPQPNNDQPYDCISLLSGGKDSSYMLARLADMGLKILAFTLDNGYISEGAKANIRRVVATLGVDHVFGSTPAMNEIFVDSLKRHANVCQGCFKTIYTLSMQMARDKNIPFVVTGLSRGQFFETRLTEDLFRDSTSDLVQIDQTVLDARKAYHRVDDAVFRSLDVESLQSDAIFQQVRILDFYRYCDVELDEMLDYLDQRLPWVRPDDTGRSTNCLINDVGIYVHRRRKGFHNYALPYSWDVRMGHKQRDAALDELDDQIDVDNVHRILGEIGYDGELGEAAGSRLVAYYVSPNPIPVDQLNAFLKEQIPAYMIPSQFVRIDEVPLSENGKVEFEALPDPTKNRSALSSTYVAPKNDIETSFAKIWGEVLRIERVGTRDSFFDLGGDSILAIQIIARAHREGIQITTSQFFESLTIETLAERWQFELAKRSTKSGARTDSQEFSQQENAIPHWMLEHDLVKSDFLNRSLTKIDNIVGIYPLSPTQQGMLFHSISQPQSGVYVVQMAVTIECHIDADRMRHSLNEVVARHSALRTAFVWEGVDQPLQIVRERVEVILDQLDWRDDSSENQRQKLLNLIAQTKRLGFQFEEAPLIRFTLVRCHDDRCILVFAFHHLILDGWSTQLLLAEIVNHYEGQIDKTPAFPFRNYIQWISDRDVQGEMAFWQQELKGFSQSNQIGSPGPAKDKNESEFRQLSHRLPEETTNRLKQLARESQVTLNTVVQALWSLTISRYCGGATDIVFGATVAGRPLNLPEIERGIGSFINTIPFRTSIKPDQPLREWLIQIQSHQATVREWDLSSLLQIQKYSEIPAGQSLFENVLVFENYPAMDRTTLSVPIGNIEHFEQSSYPLALLVVPRLQLEFIFVYDANRFSDDAIGRFMTHVEWLAQRLIEGPDNAAGTLLGLPPQHENWIREHSAIPASNRNLLEPTEFKGIHQTCIHDDFSEAVKQHPDRTAVICDGRELTYLELDQQSDRIARHLIQQGVGANSIVGICLERSVEMLIGIMGILKSGGAYVPLDMAYPKIHLQHVLADSGAKTVLTQAIHADVIPTGKHQVAFINELLSGGVGEVANIIDEDSLKGVRKTASENDLAYVIYTSGSTGQPKGVMVSHANLVSSTQARVDYYDHPPSRFLLLSPFAFDSSVAGIFWTLTTGGTLILPQPEQEKDVRALNQLIHRTSATHLLCLPTLYQLLIEEAEDDQLKTLQTAIVAGEAADNRIAKSHFELVPDAQLHNEYGPTEATVWATVYQVQPADTVTAIPIGRSIASSVVRVLDPTGVPVGIGSVGEIYLGGPGVALGYLNQPQLTKAKFVSIQDIHGDFKRMYRTGDAGYFRDDGQLMFVGRMDRQLKIRGHRIEPGKVEAAIRSLDKIDDAHVVGLNLGAVSNKLVAYVIKGDTDETKIRSQLSGLLPGIMTPEIFVFVGEIPKLANGKVDTQSLPVPTLNVKSDGHVAPRNNLESTLAKIWSDTLGISDVSVDDNFFSLGGDSILSIQIISRARRQHILLRPIQIAQNPTIAQLALVAKLEEGLETETAGPETGEIALSPIQRWFFDLELPNPNHWNLSATFELSDDYDADQLERVVGKVVSVHGALHAQFEKDASGVWRQALPDSIPTSEFELANFDSANESDFQSACLTFQSSLNIQRGPLFRLVRFINRNGRDRLLIVVHHLVVDAVSWHILMDDINHLIDEQKFELELPDCSFATYTACLKRHAIDPASNAEFNYWERVLKDSDKFRLPLVSNGLPISERSKQTIVSRLDSSATRLLRSDANIAFNTSAHQILISALALTIADWTGQAHVVLNLESHGRDSGCTKNLDLTRTVGWFTAMYPVSLTVIPDNDAASAKSIKDQLNRVPDGGNSYGGFRYLNSATADSLQKHSEPQILFNYLGVSRSKANDVQNWLMPIDEAMLTNRFPENTSPHPLEINAIIETDQLVIRTTYCEHLLTKATCEKIADSFLLRLKKLIDICVEANAVFTPSDFPNVELSQSELDELMEGLD